MTYRTTSGDVREMFGDIASRYDIANTVLSGGVHHLWKRDFVKSAPFKQGGAYLDLCCGTGDLVPLISENFGGKVIGADFCEPMIKVARERFPSFEFRVEDALSLSFAQDTFDGITVSFGVRNFENLQDGLRETLRVLKPGGVLAVLEFGQPKLFGFAQIYRLYSTYLMPYLGKFLTGNRQAYEYLPRTAGKFPCGDEFLKILQNCGFSAPRQRVYMSGIAFGYYASRPL